MPVDLVVDDQCDRMYPQSSHGEAAVGKRRPSLCRLVIRRSVYPRPPEKDDVNNSLTYTMQDVEYGFHYTITSYACEFGLDGSDSGLYYEETSDTFTKQYQRYIIDQIDGDVIADDTISYTAGAGKHCLASAVPARKLYRRMPGVSFKILKSLIDESIFRISIWAFVTEMGITSEAAT